MSRSAVKPERRISPERPDANLGLAAVAVAEPSTLVSDFLLGTFAAVLGIKLWRQGTETGHRSLRLWAAALLATGLGALAGGAWHGFHLALSPLAAALLWKLTVYSVGAASFLILAATALALLHGRARRLVLLLAGIELLLYAVWMAAHDDFLWVMLDYGLAMIAMLALHGWAWQQRREPASPWMAAGFGVSVLGAVIEASGVQLHRYLNAHDLYHGVQMVALYLFYRGAGLLTDRRV